MTNFELMQPNLLEYETMGEIEEEIKSKNFETLNFVDCMEDKREEFDAFDLEIA